MNIPSDALAPVPWRRRVDLQGLNTLAVPACADCFAEVHDLVQLRAALRAWHGDAQTRDRPVQVIGGGSNVLLAPELPGLTLRMRLAGRECLAQDEQQVLLRVGAGEDWHTLVAWCLQQGFFGLENLALIPGTVGAAPVQNIGAYGVEIASRIERVDIVDRRTGEPGTLTAADCRFGYRDSVFKGALRDRVIITHVVLRLSRQPQPVLSYPALASTLADCAHPSPQQVFDAVCRIRRDKLPDPAQVPNCGSFFKNPVVSADRFATLIERCPTLPSFPVPGSDARKLAAGWLIEQAGWKGRTWQGAVVHPQQALVLTNPQRGPLRAVLLLAEHVRDAVAQQFGVQLQLEPQMLGMADPSLPLFA